MIKFPFWSDIWHSCLIDADWLDTASFYGRKQRKELKADFQKCLERVNECLAEKTGKSQTRLQKARNEIQFQVFEKKNRDAKIYLLNMPTGSGKTLASIKFALERAISHGKRESFISSPIIPLSTRPLQSLKNCLQGVQKY